MTNKECVIKNKSIKDDILWFEIEGIPEGIVQFQLKYLDVDNNKSPRTWTQIVAFDQIEAIVNDKYLGIGLDMLCFTENVSGIELTVVIGNETYNVTDNSRDEVIDYLKFSLSRNTIYISLQAPMDNNVYSRISFSEGPETDKLVIAGLPKDENYVPTYFLMGKRYCTDSNVGPKNRKDIIRHGDEWIVLLNKNKYWDYSQDNYTLDCYVEYHHKNYNYSIVLPLMVEDFVEYKIHTSDCERKWYKTIQGTLACYVRTNSSTSIEHRQNDALKK